METPRVRGVFRGTLEHPPLGAFGAQRERRQGRQGAAALVTALDWSKAPVAPLIHEGADSQSSGTAPSLARSSEGAIDP